MNNEILTNEANSLRDAFDILAQYPDECDVEYAIFAQAEVMLSQENEFGTNDANENFDNQRC